MLNIHSILKAILSDVESASDNVVIVNDHHLIDKLSGVSFHLYDEFFQVVRGEEEKTISSSSFTAEEKATMMEIKNLLADPAVTLDKKTNYMKYLKEGRSAFSEWYENPTPAVEAIQEESDTVKYSR